MNVIGQIGQFMIDNQELIGTIVVIALAVILLWLLIAAIVKRHKKKKWENKERPELLGEVKKLSESNKVLMDTLTRVGDEETVAAALKQIEENESLASNAQETATAAEVTAEAATEVATNATEEVAEEAVSAVSEAGETVEAAAAEVQQDFQQATQQTYEDQEFMRAVQQVAQQDMHKAEPALAYMSRDANVDKYGNVYTEEMLRNQIG